VTLPKDIGPRDLLAWTAATLDKLGIQYMVVGSMASMIYGEYRSTRDVDLAVQIGQADVPHLLAAFPEDEFYLSEEAIRDAIRHHSQFNAIHSSSGLKVDFMVQADTPHADQQALRARMLEVVPGSVVRFAAPEDVILKKLQYYREGGSDKHLRDVASMIKISGDTFDRNYLEHWADELRVREEWDAIKARVGW
jgi:hypothetical protein